MEETKVVIDEEKFKRLVDAIKPGPVVGFSAPCPPQESILLEEAALEVLQAIRRFSWTITENEERYPRLRAFRQTVKKLCFGHLEQDV